MTDWKSPAVITADHFALIKLCHIISGILIWEFVMNIGFEYSVFTGKRNFRSSFLLYLGARWYPLFCVITILVGFDSTNRINCQAYATFVFLFSHLSLASASALIVLRIAAIWGLNKIAISIASAAWLANTGSLIHSIAIVRATWSEGVCKITNISETRSNIPRGGVWWLLYTQGLAWMIIVVVAQAPITVFILLNLNDPMDLMFQAPALITMTIGASRVYRGLSDYVHKESNVHMSEGLPVRQSPISYLVPRSDRCSLALRTSGIPDEHIFGIIGTDPLAPPKHHF
ncbi:hypothetical protein EDB85DRAFT_1162870 [Lactarius pseudohatsudake]|nr:hypothetical protein EDB85DRAFT_1162870 [Lactarius pseudohatsudake]